LKAILAGLDSAGTPVTLRLVKGAYWDSDTIRYRQRGGPVPLFEHKAETDANYEALVRTLLEASDVIRPGIRHP
jgi:RHH-type proline utilization regulon transcriptional repressor/proline dehydrogenase/delta 1-pyrroline-5-carboxylate dehydrogenase